MEQETPLTHNTSWTWADQISTYRFWGLALFLLFLLTPSTIVNLSVTLLRNTYDVGSDGFSIALAIKPFASLGGLWLAWFLARSKHHYFLFLFSGFTIIGLLLMLLTPSIIILSISFFLIGISLGAITLSIPTIIAGGKGGKEMFVVSFGLITSLELITQTFSHGIFMNMFSIFDTPIQTYVITGVVSVLLGVALLLPVKKDLFDIPPPPRNKTLTPKHRKPWLVALLCLVPGYNIYYIFHLAYRLHGEVNHVNPTRNILTPKAAVWTALFFSVLYPIIVASLNTNLITKLKEDNAQTFYKNRVVILWSFIFVPISYALIQSNLNRLIHHGANEITE